MSVNQKKEGAVSFEDIIQDFVSIITSYCSKIYGDRRSKRNTELLIKNLQENNVA